MNKKLKLEMLVGHIIYNTIIGKVGPITPEMYNGIYDEVLWEIEKAYKFGFADGLNTTYDNPHKCGECGGDDLLLDSNCEWDKTRRDWVVSWKETSEAYCRDCDQQVAVYQKLFGDYDANL